MRAEAGLHSVRASAALVPLRWLWRAFTLVFGASEPIGRWSYLLAVLGLLAARFGFEPDVAHLPLGYCWSFGGDSGPCVVTDDGDIIYGTRKALLLVLLPFVWGGVSMSARRAAGAGLPPWIGFLFFVPGVRYVLCLVLAVLPPRKPSTDPRAGGPFREQLEPATPATLRSTVHPVLLVKAAFLASLVGVVGPVLLGIGDAHIALPMTTAALAAFIYYQSVAYKMAAQEVRESVRRENGQLLGWCSGGLALMVGALWIVGRSSSEYGTIALLLLLSIPAFFIVLIIFYCVAVTPWSRWQ